jgi:outer membrane protein assembly factor BamB
VVLVVNHVRSRTTGLVDAQALRTLKQQLAQSPRDEALKARIRDLDFQLREEFFRRKRFSDQGALLLFGGVAVLVLALRCATGCRKTVPSPTGIAPTVGQTEQLAIMSRWSIASIAVVFGTAGLVIVMDSGQDVILEALKAANEAPQQVPDPTGQVAKPPEPETYPSAEEIGRNWPSFRGPGGVGVSVFTNVPSSWNGKTGEGIVWKAGIPLPGKNSPVVWGDRIFLTGADKDKREVYCLDAGDGELLWQRPVSTAIGSSAEPPQVLEDTGYAAPTAATDGRRVYAMFANGDMAAFDFEGKEVWSMSLGVPVNAYGHAASLALWHDLVLVQYDQASAEDGKSRLLAIKGSTGKIAWETARPVPNSWASPIVISVGGNEQVVTAAAPWVIAYEPAYGAELWRAECLGHDVGPSPAFGNGMVFVATAYAKVAAIRPDGIDNVTETHVAWTAEDGLPDVCSPLADGKRLYLISPGLLTCYDAEKGSKVWEQDIKEQYHASPVLVGDKIYLLSDNGMTTIIKAGDKYDEVGRCELGEPCYATPAFLDGRIYIRG